jgi:hypothetical protein
MHRRDWVLVSATAVLIFAVCASLVWWGRVYHGEQTQQRQHTAPHAADAAQQEAREACRAKSGHVHYFSCIAEQQRTQRDEQRAQYDLEAQQDMALWAFGLFVSGILGLIATAAGVFLVWRTLFHTKRAADAARDAVTETRRIGESQVRAYVTVSDVQMSWRRGRQFPTVSFDVGNSGNSPALEVTPSASVRFKVVDENRLLGDFNGSTGVLLGTLAQGGTRNYSIMVTSTPLSDEDIGILKSHESVVEVRINLQYKDVFETFVREQFNFLGRFKYSTHPQHKINIPPHFDFIAPPGRS